MARITAGVGSSHVPAIGAALGLIGFFLLGSQVLVYALEVTVVRTQRLWPRSILQPPLTDADKALLRAMAKQEERRPEEHVEVHFDGPLDPVQVGPLNAAFSPSEAEIAHARRVIEVDRQAAAEGRGAVALDGRMIDIPVVRRAERLLARAAAIAARRG